MKKEQTMEDWAAGEIAGMAPTPAPKGVSEEAIAAKVAAGLTRKQAIQTLQAQADQDAGTKPKGKGK